jgi:hypothetical protein
LFFSGCRLYLFILGPISGSAAQACRLSGTDFEKWASVITDKQFRHSRRQGLREAILSKSGRVSVFPSDPVGGASRKFGKMKVCIVRFTI